MIAAACWADENVCDWDALGRAREFDNHNPWTVRLVACPWITNRQQRSRSVLRDVDFGRKKWSFDCTDWWPVLQWACAR